MPKRFRYAVGSLVLGVWLASGADVSAAAGEAAPQVTTGPAAALVNLQSLDVLTTAVLTSGSIIRLTSPPATIVLKPVTLGDLVALTLDRNLDYKIDQINLEVAQDEVIAQKGIFDPLLTMSLQQQEITAQGSIFNMLQGSATGVAGARQTSAMQQPIEEPVGDIRRQQLPPDQEQQIQELLDALSRLEAEMASGLAADYRDKTQMKTRTGMIELSERSPWGGMVGVDYSIGRGWQDPSFLNINPAYSQRTSVFLVHPFPFFRNWGTMVTYSSIRLAQKNERSRQWQAHQQLLDQMAAVAKGYWDLVNAIYNAEVARLSLETARNLLRINEIRLANEVGTEIDVAEARAGVALRENTLIQTVQAIGSAQDNLARITRVNEGHDWKIQMIPRDMPRFAEYPADEQTFIADALQKRPDIQQARLSKARADIRRKVARNQRMPRLDAFGEYGISGLGPTPGEAWHHMGTQDYDNWTFGLDFSVPIPNRKARYRYKQARNLVEGTDLVIQQIEDLAVFEVRDAIRKLRTARDSITANRTRVEAERRKFNGEIKRFEVGMATVQDLLDYQEDLARAQSSLIVAIAEYNKAVYDIERARGTLLEFLKISVPMPEDVAE